MSQYSTLEKNKRPLGSALFGFAVSCYIGVGVFSLVFPPTPLRQAAKVEIPREATCLRATRHADFTTVDITMGTPAIQVPTLLRLDDIRLRNSEHKSLRLFTPDVVESRTVHCEASGNCHDVFYVSDGFMTSNFLTTASFEYRHGSVERSMYTTASSIPGVFGEFFLKEGFNYWLTSTHLCYADVAVSHVDGVVFDINGGSIVIPQNSDFSKEDLLSLSPSFLYCNGSSSNVTLFPSLSSVEASWLSIADTRIYNTEPVDVENRRIISEIGVPCAASPNSSLSRDLVLYQLDCAPFQSCRQSPSVPFRRLATASLFIGLHNSTTSIKTSKEESMDGLPRLANSDAAFYTSLLKMAMITLAAAVVFVRSLSVTSSSSWLVKHAIGICSTQPQKPPAETQTTHKSFSNNVFEDRFIGFVAILSRATLVSIRYIALTKDRQGRVCTTEVLGSIISLFHFCVRYFGLIITDNTQCEGENASPVHKLGGSTAIIDSTAAVMLAFSEPPTLAAVSSSFDPTARMLIALLLSTIVIPRCSFSAACCGSLFHTFNMEGLCEYAYMNILSGVLWCAQSAFLGVMVCDLFVSPVAYSVSRSSFGDDVAMLVTRILMFFGLVVSGLPRLLTTSRHILSTKDHYD